GVVDVQRVLVFVAIDRYRAVDGVYRERGQASQIERIVASAAAEGGVDRGEHSAQLHNIVALLTIDGQQLEAGAEQRVAGAVEGRIDRKGVVALAAIHLEALDAGVIDQPAADHLDGRAGDLENVIELAAIDNDGVEAIAAIDVNGGVNEIGDRVRADAAFHHGIATGDEGVEDEGIVAVFTVEEQLARISVNLEVVVAVAAVDRHREAGALDGQLIGVGAVAIGVDDLAVLVNGRADGEPVVSLAAVDGCDGAVVQDHEGVGGIVGVDLQGFDARVV